MPFRIVIGVTGHRNLRAVARLEEAVDSVLEEIIQGASGKGSEAVRLAVLSPLAEGADRLVARRVLAREGAELEVVLPFPEDEYSKDFELAGSRAEFAGLLTGARSIERLPPAPTREEAYARAGRHVVDHCDVLIALWDGKPEEGPGGTAEVVRFARAQGRPLFIIDPCEAGRIQFEEGRNARGA